MNYRILALAIGALSSAHITTAPAQSIYVAPGGVFIGGGPVYVNPAPSTYAEPIYGYGVPAPTPYLAPPVVAPRAGYVAAALYGNGYGYGSAYGYGYGYGNAYGYGYGNAYDYGDRIGYGNGYGGYGYGYGNGIGYGYGNGIGYGYGGIGYGSPRAAYYNGGPVLRAYSRARLFHPARRLR